MIQRGLNLRNPANEAPDTQAERPATGGLASQLARARHETPRKGSAATPPGCAPSVDSVNSEQGSTAPTPPVRAGDQLRGASVVGATPSGGCKSGLAMTPPDALASPQVTALSPPAGFFGFGPCARGAEADHGAVGNGAGASRAKQRPQRPQRPQQPQQRQRRLLVKVAAAPRCIEQAPNLCLKLDEAGWRRSVPAGETDAAAARHRPSPVCDVEGEEGHEAGSDESP